jgi:hypothetical protein
MGTRKKKGLAIELDDLGLCWFSLKWRGGVSR